MQQVHSQRFSQIYKPDSLNKTKTQTGCWDDRQMVAQALKHCTTEEKLPIARQVCASWTKVGAHARSRVDTPTCDFCPGGGMTYNIQGANEAPRKRCRAP